MKWNYRHHDRLCFLLQKISHIVRFLEQLSWEHAHYRNGRGKPLNSKSSLGQLWKYAREDQ